MVKKLVFTAMIHAVLLGGCTTMEIQQSNQSLREEILAHLQEKYGEEFIYVGPWGTTFSPGKQMIVATADKPERHIIVDAADDGSIVRDNYLAMKFENETRAVFTEIAARVFGEVRLFYTPPTASQSIDISPDASLELFLADTEAWHPVLVVVSKNHFVSKEQAQEAAQQYAATGGYFFLTVLVVENDAYENDELEQFNDRITQNNFIHCAIIDISENGTDITWLEVDRP
jgi:hypothetical protein